LGGGFKGTVIYILTIIYILTMKIILQHKFEDLISIDNLLLAWQEFLKGKRSKRDVQIFQFNLMDNILQLHGDLKNKLYKHGGYQQFKINDPKPRIIHKASVRDRLLHHAVYRILYPFFDHRVLRGKTKKRMLRRIKKNSGLETLNSYLGLLKHGKSDRIKENILNRYV